MSLTIFYYVVSILAVFLYVTSVQFKKKKDILILQLLSSIGYFLVYLIKGATSGAAVKIIEQLKDLVFIKYEEKNRKIPVIILIIFLGLLIGISIFFYDGVLSLLPLFINILMFVSTYLKNPKYMRYLMLICGALWAIYNIYAGAYVILIGNAIEMVSGLISIIKYKDIDKEFDRKARKKR